VKIKTKMKEERKKEEREKMNNVSLFVTDLDPLQFFSLSYVVDLNHSFTYFLSLLRYFFILCNLVTIGLRKREKTLERKLERIQIRLLLILLLVRVRS
jgi:hypothetical protein